MLTSHAQNLEDVVLGRALWDIRLGHYVDIGAQDPSSNSVSLAFYKRGWRGTHVEPTTVYAARLAASRPDEQIYEIALGADAGLIDFFEIGDTGLSTGEAEIAAAHEQNGFSSIKKSVKVETLDWLFGNLAYPVVHWLKIDVEGMEEKVLKGWKTSKVRPWVLIIEAIHPVSKCPSYTSWEAIVLEKGYVFAYFDGLNRFYLHHTQIDRKQFFDNPPNIFDSFSLATEDFVAQMCDEKSYEMEKQALEIQALENTVASHVEKLLYSDLQESELNRQILWLKTNLSDTYIRLSAANDETTRLTSTLEAVLSSRSWRWTKVFRIFGAFEFKSRNFNLKARIRSLLMSLAGSTYKNPFLRVPAVWLVKTLRLERRLRLFFIWLGKSPSLEKISTPLAKYPSVSSFGDLSAAGKRIYLKLREGN